MSGYYSNPKTNSKGEIINQLPSANAFTSALLNGIKYATSSVNNPAQATRNALAKKTVEDLMASKAYKTKTSGDKSGGSSGSKAQPTPTAPVDVGGYTDFEAIARAQAEAEAARLAALRQAANEAYERNMSRIADSYNNAAGNLRSNYDSTVGRLNEARDKSLGDVNSDAEKSLQEAYINNMLTRRNLNQRLAAMGYNGGATETTMGSLENQYGASRAGINEALNKSIANLNQTYGDNLAGALQSYNSAMSNLGLQRMQLENAAENARNNLEASYRPSTENLAMDQNYVNALRNVVARQGQFSFDPTKATNNFVAGNAQQAQSAATGTNFAKWLEQLQLDAQKGATVRQIEDRAYEAMERGELGLEDVANLFATLGITI